MNPRLSGHFSKLGLVFFVLKPLLGIARQWSREKFPILSLKPGSHVRLSIYQTITELIQDYNSENFITCYHPRDTHYRDSLGLVCQWIADFNQVPHTVLYD